MEKFIFDGILAIFFLAVLVVFNRFSDLFKAEDRDGYRHIAAGLSILAFVATLRFGATSVGFSGIAVPAGQNLAEILLWIGSISGIVLILSGLSSWLPIARIERQIGRTKTARLEAITKISQLIRIENRYLELLKAALGYTAEACDFNRSAIFVFSHARKECYFLHAVDQTTSGKFGAARIQFSSKVWERTVTGSCRQPQQLVADYPVDLPKAEIVEPIFVSGRIVAVMLFWTNDSVQSNSELTHTVTTIARLLGRRGRTALVEEQLDFYKQVHETTDAISRLDVDSGELTSVISSLYTILRSKMPVESFGIKIVRGGEADRYTVGSNGAVLRETGLNKSSLSDSLNRLELNGQASSLCREDIDRRFGIRALFDHCGQVADFVTVLPMAYNDYLLLSFRLAGSHQFRPRYRELVETVSAPLLNKIDTVMQVVRDRRLTLALDSFSRLIESMPGLSVKDALAATLELLIGPMNLPAARLMMLDDSKSFFNSLGLVHQRSVKAATPPDGTMISSLMPGHLRAVKKGRTVVVTGPELSDSERNQVFGPSVASLLIVPVVQSTETVLMTIGLNSEFNLDRREIALIESNARMAAARLNGDLFISDETRSSTRTRIRSALSGMFGAIELWESKAESDPGDDRYLRLVRSSAERLAGLTGESKSMQRLTHLHEEPV